MQKLGEKRHCWKTTSNRTTNGNCVDITSLKEPHTAPLYEQTYVSPLF